MAETVNVDDYPPDVIMKAFWLQRHIHEHGIDGIFFMQQAEEKADDDGPEIVRNKIIKQLRNI